jgi:hypothetical protein
MIFCCASEGDYSEQLHRWSCMLSGHRLEEFHVELARNPAGEGARLHLANAVGDRRDMLRRALGLVALAFPNLDAQLDAFLRSSPFTAFDLENSDAENCLRWMADTLPLTPRQASFVGYQLGELAVEALARRDRGGYVRFQRMLGHGPIGWEHPAQPGAGPILHVNPTRAWRRLVTPGSASDGPGEPRDALFYAAGGAVRYLPPDPETAELVRKLIELAPCPLEEWAAHAGDAGESVRGLAARLAREGFLAVTA